MFETNLRHACHTSASYTAAWEWNCTRTDMVGYRFAMIFSIHSWKLQKAVENLGPVWKGSEDFCLRMNDRKEVDRWKRKEFVSFRWLNVIEIAHAALESGVCRIPGVRTSAVLQVHVFHSNRLEFNGVARDSISSFFSGDRWWWIEPLCSYGRCLDNSKGIDARGTWYCVGMMQRVCDLLICLPISSFIKSNIWIVVTLTLACLIFLKYFSFVPEWLFGDFCVTFLF